MHVIEIGPKDHTITDLAKRAYQTSRGGPLDSAQVKRAIRALREANPQQLGSVRELTPGIPVFVPTVEGLTAQKHPEIETDVGKATVSQLAAMLDTLSKAVEADAKLRVDETRHTLDLVKSARLRALANRNQPAKKLIAETKKNAEQTLKRLEASRKELTLALESLRGAG